MIVLASMIGVLMAAAITYIIYKQKRKPRTFVKYAPKKLYINAKIVSHAIQIARLLLLLLARSLIEE